MNPHLQKIQEIRIGPRKCIKPCTVEGMVECSRDSKPRRPFVRKDQADELMSLERLVDFLGLSLLVTLSAHDFKSIPLSGRGLKSTSSSPLFLAPRICNVTDLSLCDSSIDIQSCAVSFVA